MKLKLLITIFLIVLTSCTPVPQFMGTTSPTAKSSPAVLMPTLTTSVSILPTSSPASTHSINWGKSENCVTLYSDRSNIDPTTDGILVLLSLAGKKTGLDMSLLDLSNGKSSQVATSSQPVLHADVSPDRQKLAYVWFNNANSKWELMLVDITGVQQKVVWSSVDIFAFSGWLNNHQVVVIQNLKYIILDLNSGSQEKFSPQDFPELDLSMRPDFYVSFDPSVTRVLYKDGGTILFDLAAQKIVARIPDKYYDRDPINAWDASGKYVAVVATIDTKTRVSSPPNEIFVISQDGNIRQLTHFYETFGRSFGIEGLTWSPNGEKIAFWASDVDKEYLVIANILNGDLKNYCISSVASSKFDIYLAAPIWSADEKQLLVENRYDANNSRLLIVDFDKNIAFPIAENQFPVGWMTKEP